MKRQPVYRKISSEHAILERGYMSTIGYFIPPGYMWDGMSMNWIALIEKFGERVDIASIEHDYEYVYEGDIPNMERVTRKFADTKLLINLIDSGVPKIHAYFIFGLVRIFGYVKWRSWK